MNSVLKIYHTLSRLPLGKRIFSRLVCLKAPYFATIRPLITDLEPGRGRITMRDRRSVHNHLGSVHAIAMCNLCELVGGLTLDVTLPRHLRWIPRGMRVEYLKIARTSLAGTCSIPDVEVIKPGSLEVGVHITDTGGAEVFKAVIDMHITERK